VVIRFSSLLSLMPRHADRSHKEVTPLLPGDRRRTHPFPPSATHQSEQTEPPRCHSSAPPQYIDAMKKEWLTHRHRGNAGTEVPHLPREIPPPHPLHQAARSSRPRLLQQACLTPPTQSSSAGRGRTTTKTPALTTVWTSSRLTTKQKTP
jgi:hypothetical protein